MGQYILGFSLKSWSYFIIYLSSFSLCVKSKFLHCHCVSSIIQSYILFNKPAILPNVFVTVNDKGGLLFCSGNHLYFYSVFCLPFGGLTSRKSLWCKISKRTWLRILWGLRTNSYLIAICFHRKILSDESRLARPVPIPAWQEIYHSGTLLLP